MPEERIDAGLLGVGLEQPRSMPRLLPAPAHEMRDPRGESLPEIDLPVAKQAAKQLSIALPTVCAALYAGVIALTLGS